MEAVAQEVAAPVRFAREAIASVFDEIQPLLQEHWREIAQFPDIALDPDFDQYRVAEGKGHLRIFTARTQDELVGYAIYFLAPALHYRRTLIAMQDILYLRTDHRRGLAGWRLIGFADRQLRADGVQIVYQRVKAAHNYSAVLERLGYELAELTYSHRLK